uniref:tRNA (32-2'-O)-methyltransferase regulator THADA n=1 Tax=Heliothis virescens TaxID=7102 RepID=A0A2A4K9T3_HELVI
MNGLALRINRGGGGKSKNSIGCSPIAIPTSLFENTEKVTKEVHEFMNSVSTDDQLVILKNIIDTIKQPIDDITLKFLVAVFFQAEAKHPIKCVVSRHIIKNKQLQQPFSDTLAVQITSHITARPSSYKQYADVVGKLITCIENFPAGVQAMKMVELALARYLTNCLNCCVTTLRDQKTLSPTEKNEIFNLAHITIRLLLHITQKIDAESKSNLTLMFEEIRLLIQGLMFDDDVPMDTKSVGGILYLTMHVTEYGMDSWTEVLNSSTTISGLSKLLTLEAGRLSLYSAIVTVVPADQLYTHTVDDEPAILSLTKKILDIGERSSSEAAFILAVARTALQLGKLVSGRAGLAPAHALLGFAWGQLEHHMDSVRHLAGQLLACLVRYCAHADATGDSRGLDTLTGALSSLERTRKSYYICVSHIAAELPARTVRALVRPSDLLPALREQPLHNTARAALEALLDKCVAGCSEEELHSEWLQPLLQCAKVAADDLQLGALQHVLVRAATHRPDVREYLLQYIKEASTNPHERDLKCVLMLLRVVRAAPAADTPPHGDGHWKGIISYDVLGQAAVDAVDEQPNTNKSLVQQVFHKGLFNTTSRTRSHSAGDIQNPNINRNASDKYNLLDEQSQDQPHSDLNLPSSKEQENITKQVPWQRVPEDNQKRNRSPEHTTTTNKLQKRNEARQQMFNKNRTFTDNMPPALETSNRFSLLNSEEGEGDMQTSSEKPKKISKPPPIILYGIKDLKQLTSFVDETREVFAAGDLRLVLQYLEHNINAQAPNFRQAHTSLLMKKYFISFEESYAVISKSQLDPNGSGRLRSLRALCFASCCPALTYSRRCGAAALAWLTETLEGFRGWERSTWSKLHATPGGGQLRDTQGFSRLRMLAAVGLELLKTRILSLSLIVESPKSTEVFAAGDLRLVLQYLEHNINAQAPNFRQLTLSAMKKFIKRFEESYAVIYRESQSRPNGSGDKVAYYLHFAAELRRLCFASLLPGANYSRRFVALQLLAWCEQIHLEGYQRSWEPEYVDKLLRHLEDSYENNKAFALEVLASCPVELLKSKSYSISLDLEDIIRQASLLKPTECVSAAYKLDLLRMKLPEYILQDEQCDTSQIAERVSYCLCGRLLRAARAQLAVCRGSVLAAAARAPMYGVLHCLAHTLQHVDPVAISSDEHWSALVSETFETCMSVSSAVGGVVSSSSPEGHLPMDMTLQLTDHGNSGNVTLDDGRQVTAQMVLLCAWRSVKEVSLLLGGMCGRLSVRGEGGQAGTLSEGQLLRAGEHFTRLLADTKHRGAFEQAYVGFTMLLDRLWRCRSLPLHVLPRAWLRELLRAVADDAHSLCATRRSAGLPFMIQALVSTEVQVQGNPLCFHECMSCLVSLCACGSARARGHALHVLRALVRHAALAQRVAPYVAPALLAALQAFDANTWAERNSATLLLSALVSRVFGVTRAGMTGRIFFLRYPQLYDFMLAALTQGGADAHTLRPALYAVLLLLARLYPSSLEGTETNLKLVSFIPHVQACARSRVLHTRRLAARALVPLVPHQLPARADERHQLEHKLLTVDAAPRHQRTCGKPARVQHAAARAGLHVRDERHQLEHSYLQLMRHQRHQRTCGKAGACAARAARAGLHRTCGKPARVQHAAARAGLHVRDERHQLEHKLLTVDAAHSGHTHVRQAGACAARGCGAGLHVRDERHQLEHKLLTVDAAPAAPAHVRQAGACAARGCARRLHVRDERHQLEHKLLTVDAAPAAPAHVRQPARVQQPRCARRPALDADQRHQRTCGKPARVQHAAARAGLHVRDERHQLEHKLLTVDAAPAAPAHVRQAGACAARGCARRPAPHRAASRRVCSTRLRAQACTCGMSDTSWSTSYLQLMRHRGTSARRGKPARVQHAAARAGLHVRDERHQLEHKLLTVDAAPAAPAHVRQAGACAARGCARRPARADERTSWSTSYLQLMRHQRPAHVRQAGAVEHAAARAGLHVRDERHQLEHKLLTVDAAPAAPAARAASRRVCSTRLRAQACTGTSARAASRRVCSTRLRAQACTCGMSDTSWSTSYLPVDAAPAAPAHVRQAGACADAAARAGLHVRDIGELWRCRSLPLHVLPRAWLRELLRAVADDAHSLCATRRSAGLPFMIQALVSTEVQVQGNPLCFHECMSCLVSLCACGSARARGHALHVLRALVRHAALAQRVAPYVAPALLAALQAFDANTWAERNSATLLLSALVSRVFGVTRAGMTGRIFFLRYPQLYDFMLAALTQGGADAHTLRPALYAVLLLLARLYPSSLEGTETNLKVNIGTDFKAP